MTHRIMILCSLLFCDTAAAKTKLVVLPVIPIAGEVGEGPAREMTEAMAEELKRVDSLEVSAAVPDSATVPAAPETPSPRLPARSDAGLRTALADIDEGSKHAEKLRFPQAIKSLTKGIDGLTKNLDLLDDYDKLIDAYLLLAVAHFRRGQQGPGTDVLEQVARLRPDLSFKPGQYPPVFVGTFDQARNRALARKRGSIKVTSTPLGAKVFLNGRPLGVTPLLIEDIIPGENHLVVRAPSQTFGQIVAVGEGRVSDVSAPLGDEPSEPKVSVSDAVAANRFDRDLRLALRRIGLDKGGDYILVTAMGKGKGVYALSSFLLDTRTGKWQALDPAAPDLDMLSASIEAHNLARNLAAKVVGFKGDEGDDTLAFIAGKPMNGRSGRVQPTLARVAFVGTGGAATGGASVSAGNGGDSGTAGGSGSSRQPVVATASAPSGEPLDGSPAPDGSRSPATPARREPPLPVPAAAPGADGTELVPIPPPPSRPIESSTTTAGTGTGSRRPVGASPAAAATTSGPGRASATPAATASLATTASPASSASSSSSASTTSTASATTAAPTAAPTAALSTGASGSASKNAGSTRTPVTSGGGSAAASHSTSSATPAQAPAGGASDSANATQAGHPAAHKGPVLPVDPKLAGDDNGTDVGPSGGPRRVVVASVQPPSDDPLAPRPDLGVEAGESTPIVQKWWFWTAIGVGAAALAGGAYLVFSAEREPSSGTLYAVW